MKKLKDVSGTTLALTSLAVFAAAAVVSTPMWIYYRQKRKRIDSLAGTPPADAGPKPLPEATDPERSDEDEPAK